MKLFGDADQKQKDFAIQLTNHELGVDMDDDIDAPTKAQCFVCLSADWYQMGMEEEGNRLLAKAEATYPGYFKNMLKVHTANNKTFDNLVKSITIELIKIVIETSKERKF